MKDITIPDLLEKFDFVQWDRYTDFLGKYNIYGWIDREKDDYKDFILLMIDKINGSFTAVTSSVEKHKEIFSIVAGDNIVPPNCIRVEDTWPQVKNSIKLNSRPEKGNDHKSS